MTMVIDRLLSRGKARVKSRTLSSEITVLKSEITAEITVFSRNLKHFSVYYHPRLIITLKSSEITKSRTQNQPVPYPLVIIDKQLVDTIHM